MSALTSRKTDKNDDGTFATGLIFLDWLKKTNQSAWQILPLNETQLEPGSSTKHIPSPYKSYGIGLDPKYLSESFVGMYPSSSEKRDFVAAQNEWLPDYALFCALQDHFKTDDWRKWDKDLRDRDKTTLAYWSEQLAKKIDSYINLQWKLHQSYAQIKIKAKKLGIVLMGDLPFYVSINSPLIWAHQDVFQIEKDGNMRYVSGVPGGQESIFGRQVWGHPLYNWENKDRHEVISTFWKIRLRHMDQLFDYVRFDYAKGMFQYGAMDRSNDQDDTFKNGPGEKFFKELVEFNRLFGVTSFVEDCGRNLEQIRESMERFNIPGVRILCFGLDKKREEINNDYVDIPNYPVNTVAYTTMHDTETLLGYIKKLTPEQKQRLAIAANTAYDPDNKTFAVILRAAVIASPAQTVIIPIQDWLLTTDRINIPGTELEVNDTNWNFRMKIPIEELPINL
jgi:4-alpha-glucanotransferase